MKNDPVFEALRQASHGLTYVSETDAPLAPFQWHEKGELTKDRLIDLSGTEKGVLVEQASLDSFLRAVPSEQSADFQKLADVLRQQLRGVNVYKIGDGPEKKVYVVGRTPHGTLAGVQTRVVET